MTTTTYEPGPATPARIRRAVRLVCLLYLRLELRRRVRRKSRPDVRGVRGLHLRESRYLARGHEVGKGKPRAVARKHLRLCRIERSRR